MKNSSHTEENESTMEDDGLESPLDFSKARPSRFAGQSDRRHLVLLLDKEITGDLTLAKFSSLVAARWRGFAADWKTIKNDLGLKTNKGLLVASVFIPLLQVYETDSNKTIVFLDDLLREISSEIRGEFVRQCFLVPKSFWNLEELVSQRPEVEQVFYSVVVRTESLKLARQALGKKWQLFANELEREALQGFLLTYRVLDGGFDLRTEVLTPRNLTISGSKHLTILGQVKHGTSQLPYRIAA
jgi:hypothetical protein